MKAEMFDKIVEARANERVQKKIDEFRNAVYGALRGLGVGEAWTQEAKAVLRVMLRDDRTKGWPDSLWERERKAVSEELLATMDVMQKALVAADRAEPGENSPESPEPPETPGEQGGGDE